MTSLAIQGTTEKKVTIPNKGSEVLWRLSLIFGPLGRAFSPPFEMGTKEAIFNAHLVSGP